MSADTERLFRRVVSLEDEIEKQNDFLREVGVRLKRLEQPKPPAEKRGQVYRIDYRHERMKPTFIHVRANSVFAALVVFLDETSPIHIASATVDNEYNGPLLNERVENPVGNAPKRMEEALPPGIYEAVVLVAGVPDRYGHVYSEEELREMTKYKGFKVRLEYGKIALVAQVTVPVALVQEKSDADDI